jgi:hypothetical protein
MSLARPPGNFCSTTIQVSGGAMGLLCEYLMPPKA